MIDAQTLRHILDYDPGAGIFIWKNSTRRKWNGREAGWLDKDSYVHIRIEGRLYPAHRLAWLYMTGSWPIGIIDHIDLRPFNNKWANLRDVPKRTNQENRARASKRSTTGLLGVQKNGKRFSAGITSNYKYHYLGTFDTPEEAHIVYVEAKRKLHAGCTI